MAVAGAERNPAVKLKAEQHDGYLSSKNRAQFFLAVDRRMSALTVAVHREERGRCKKGRFQTQKKTPLQTV